MQQTYATPGPDPGGAVGRRGGRRLSRFVVALLLAFGCALPVSLLSVQSVQAQWQGGNTHVVQQGESLGQIAQRYGIGWQDLAQWNGIADASRVYPGQTLVLYAGSNQTGGSSPSWSYGNRSGHAEWSSSGSATASPATGNSAWSAAPSSTGSSATGSSSTGSGGTHVVQAGETLVGIAQQHGVTPPQLVRVNNLSSPPAIYPGQTLHLPGGSSGGAAWGGQGSTQPSQREWQTPEPAAQPSRSAGQSGTQHSAQTPQAPSQHGKVILISIAQQHLWAFENGRLVLQTPVTTGRPGADTPTGTYDVLVKYSPYRFVSPYPPGHEFYYDPVDSNYSLRITWNGHHIHDAPWRTDFGPGTNLPHNNSHGQMATGSIGCVNVPTAAMAQLYQWADEGIQVVIQ